MSGLMQFPVDYWHLSALNFKEQQQQQHIKMWATINDIREKNDNSNNESFILKITIIIKKTSQP